MRGCCWVFFLVRWALSAKMRLVFAAFPMSLAEWFTESPIHVISRLEWSPTGPTKTWAGEGKGEDWVGLICIAVGKGYQGAKRVIRVDFQDRTYLSGGDPHAKFNVELGEIVLYFKGAATCR